jgi:hypothetical protein
MKKYAKSKTCRNNLPESKRSLSRGGTVFRERVDKFKQGRSKAVVVQEVIC